MYRKTLIPLDRSELAEAALPVALSLAERSGGEVHLVSVAPSVPSFGLVAENESSAAGWLQEGRASALEYLEKVRTRIGETGTSVAIHTQVLSGTPVRALHQWVLESGVDQVVMTTHGRGRIERLWLGSVADGLVRNAPCPILFWRPKDGATDLRERPSFRRILVPLDGSELAEAMVPWAEGLARLFRVPLSLLSVVSTPLPVGSPYLPHAGAEQAEHAAEAERMEGYLAGVAGRLRESGIEVDAEVLIGRDAAEGILSHGKRIGADLVALSTHGRGGVTRLVLGSVADKVIRGGEGHVLVHLDAEAQ